MPKRQMLINFVPGEECRIAIVEDGRLDEFYQERASTESHVGNIYKGRVSNVEPSIQAAFVDFGLERNGFLHISDLHPMYFPGDHKEDVEMVGQKTPRRERPPIQKCLRRGQEILVQVLKEGIGTKGPTLTSYLSIPGRYLVMMPYMERLGVSRKIEDDEARRESRQILAELNPPEGFGFIIRTAGIGRAKTDLKRDLAYLVRLWKSIERQMKALPGVGELYTESDLLIRTLRDVYASDIERIIVDEPTAARRARDFLAVASPRAGSSILLYQDPAPLFHRYGVERQIDSINAREVPLPSGGSLVFDQAEALVAIDVNSGKFRDNRDAETTAYKTDLEACDEVCRQLRLRDLGGVVVIDMIDLRLAKHRREVEQRFRNNLKDDRARTQVLPMSRFGIIEMTRQRMRPSLTKATSTACPHCLGTGHVRNAETVVLDVMRRLALAMQHKEVARLELTVSPDVAFQLLNRKRSMLVNFEQQHGKPVMVRVNAGGAIDYINLACFDARNGAVAGESVVNLPEPKLEPIESVPVEEGSEIEDTETLEAEVAPTQVAEDMAETPVAPAPTEMLSDDQAQAEPDNIEDENTPLAPPTRPTSVQTRGHAQAQRQGDESAGKGGRRRRRRGRRGRGRGAPTDVPPDGSPDISPETASESDQSNASANAPVLESESASVRDHVGEDEAQAPTAPASPAVRASSAPLFDEDEDNIGNRITDPPSHAITSAIQPPPQAPRGNPPSGQPTQEQGGNGRRRRRRGRRGRGGGGGGGGGGPQGQQVPQAQGHRPPQGAQPQSKPQGHPQPHAPGQNRPVMPAPPVKRPVQPPAPPMSRPTPAQPPRPAPPITPPAAPAQRPSPINPTIRRPSPLNPSRGYRNVSRPRNDRSE